MTCAEFEIILCDYLDGSLDSARNQTVEAHIQECGACAEFARDAGAAVAFMERAAEITPPPELLTRIAFGIPSGRAAAADRKSGFFKKWLQPVLQPRWAMGMAMTILSFSMIGRFAGIEVRQLNPSDLNPVKVWSAADDKLHRAWQRTVKYYDSLRVVYEVQSRLKEWTDQEEEEKRAQTAGQQTSGSAAQVSAPKGTSSGNSKSEAKK
jgi:hypothetical protein